MVPLVVLPPGEVCRVVVHHSFSGGLPVDLSSKLVQRREGLENKSFFSIMESRVCLRSPSLSATHGWS